MDTSIGAIAQFIAGNVPSPAALALAGPPALLWAVACLVLAGLLKARWRWKTGYTRKVFHFLIFGSAAAVHARWGTRGVCLFGGMASLVIAWALLRGPGSLLYEALAREKDAPHRTYFIVVPWFATLLGGFLSNLLFPSTALLGYLVTGLGDAVAEPVGTRFGKHEYRTPTLSGIRATRTLEGSCAVFLASLLALAVCLALSLAYDPSARSVSTIVLIALASTLAEAVSPHGWDNATLQIVPALLGSLLL
jgi:phytol kinase